MPVRKSTRSSKTDSAKDESATPSDQEMSENPEPASFETEPAEASPQVPEERQLFFSTDGSETESPREKPAEVVKPTSENLKDSRSEGNSRTEHEELSSQQSTKSSTNSHSGRFAHSPKSGQQGHPQGSKKMSWQEKKKLRKRQKFKKPQRLPYEETESKPLEIGQLLEVESLKSLDQISAMIQPFLDSDQEPLNLDDFLTLNLLELTEKVRQLPLNEELPAAPLREELFDALLEFTQSTNTPVFLTGIIQVMEDGHGFILQQKEDYRLKSQSVFVPECVVRKSGLKTGHSVKGLIRSKMEDSSCPIMLRVDEVMGTSPEDATRVTPFTELTPYYPLQRMYLETHQEVEWDNVAMRVVDLVSPVGFGQRGLIVAPPRTGKTVLQQGIARALRKNNPDAYLIVLLVDERPEEVTDFRRQVPDAEVIASTFDESAESHVHAAEMVIEKARRMVEHNQHVVILLDSITRLARAYNTTMPNSGKILSGGVEATALQRPKRFFGSARNIEGGGSLTILGTALVETGSKMDEVIFEEFKGTGNMELHLDRELSNKRIFPALDFEKSGTRKEELLYHPDELSKIYALRRSMKGVPPAEAMEMFIQRVRKTKNNPEFLMGLGK